MRLNYYTESRFVKGRDGRVYSPNDPTKYSHFKKYLSFFCEVNVIARVQYLENYHGIDKDLVEGENVTVSPVIHYIGPVEFLSKRKKVVDDIKKTINKHDAYILRVPGTIGSIASRFLKKVKKEYAVEVVGDPYEVFSKNGVKHPLRLLFRYVGAYNLRRVVENAKTALYVTAKTLQLRYPNRYAFGISDVEIHPGDLFEREKDSFLLSDHVRLISIGSLEQMYKGADIVLQSVQLLKERGHNIILTWIGEGKHKTQLIELAKKMGVEKNVYFLGYIGDRGVINRYLDSSDLFVLASRTEGLPRVILEVFARSLPVLASNVGGIPELVDSKFLFKSENVAELSDKIEKFINNKELFFSVGTNNYGKAQCYTYEKLSVKRELFFKKILEK